MAALVHEAAVHGDTSQEVGLGTAPTIAGPLHRVVPRGGGRDAVAVQVGFGYRCDT